MLVEYPIKDCLKVRGDLGALLEVKAEVQAVLYKHCVKQVRDDNIFVLLLLSNSIE